MRPRRFIAIALVSLAGGVVAVASEHGPHWTHEGATGAEHWGELDSSFAACAQGERQSPIDLTRAASSSAAPIAFHYRRSKLRIVNNGHTIQVGYDRGSSIEVDGTHYALLQFHFHAPSEHAVDGKHHAAELHLVHRSEGGALAVVGVLLDTGSANAAMKPIWDHLPEKPGPETEIAADVDAAALLPAKRLAFRYEGSLTTPPCSEGVRWLVLTEPVSMASEQLMALRRIIGANNRPLQARGDRTLGKDSEAATSR